MKNKKELYEENIKLRKYLHFWLGTTDAELDLNQIEVDYKKRKNKKRNIKRTILVVLIITLCIACYIAGVLSI